MFMAFFGPSDEEIRNRASDQSPALFYPGSGQDYGPMWYFYHNYGIKKFIHVDYIYNYIEPPEENLEPYKIAEKKIDKNKLLSYNDPHFYVVNPVVLLQENFPDHSIESCKEIFPPYFGVYSWDYFWDPECPESNRCPSYGIKIVLTSANDTIEFYYLKTDAIGTYNLLVKLGWNIQVMVIQEHGFGCLWTGFAGKSKLYEIAKHYNKFPKYLFVAESQKTWPGYKQTRDAVLIKRGQMHDIYRAVCEYTPEVKTSKQVVRIVQESKESEIVLE